MLSEFLEVQSTRYEQIVHPVLLVTGEADTIVPAWNHADRLTEQIRSTVRVDFAETGHALHHAHPERVAALVERFSSRLRNLSEPAGAADFRRDTRGKPTVVQRL